MTTLAADLVRDLTPGDLNDLPVVASDIIYGGAAVGIVAASGLARPLTSVDRFGGFAQRQCDNSAGAASAKHVRVVRRGIVTLPISGAVITDVGAHVWAIDDDTFALIGTGGVYIGRVVRFVSSGIVDVQFDAGVMNDPFEGYLHESVATSRTIAATDSGKVLWITADAQTFTLPSVEGLSGVIIANAGAYGAFGITVAAGATDMVEGANITAADNKGLINTKATAQRGDFVEIDYSDANGYVARRIRGTWARVA
jgi:hypothetical protein